MCLAVPGRIERISCTDALTRTGEVSFGGTLKDVNLAFVPEAGCGQYVLVHAGFAITRIDEVEAMRVFEYLQRIDGLDELSELDE
jgi:hydrogenase expression/formation protein HypC